MSKRSRRAKPISEIFSRVVVGFHDGEESQKAVNAPLPEISAARQPSRETAAANRAGQKRKAGRGLAVEAADRPHWRAAAGLLRRLCCTAK